MSFNVRISYDIDDDRVATMQPGRSTFQEHIQASQDKLNNIKKIINSTLSKFGRLTPEQMEDFAYAVDDQAYAEIDALKVLLDEAHAESMHTAARMAGIWDSIKNVFKSKEDRAHDDRQKMHRERREDASKLREELKKERELEKLKKETNYNTKYYKMVTDVLNYYKGLMKSPTKGGLEDLRRKIDLTLPLGEQILKGTYHEVGSDEAPMELQDYQLELIDDEPSSNFEEGIKGKPSKKKAPKEITSIDSMLGHLLRVKKDPQKRQVALKKLYEMLKKELETSGEVLTASERISSFLSHNPSYRPDIIKVCRLAFNL